MPKIERTRSLLKNYPYNPLVVHVNRRLQDLASFILPVAKAENLETGSFPGRMREAVNYVDDRRPAKLLRGQEKVVSRGPSPQA